MYYSLRVDLSASVSVNDVVDFLETRSDGTYCYCVEGRDTNRHMHCYFHANVGDHSLRIPLRALGLRGNKDYSLKTSELYPIKYFAYMMKEGNYNFSHLPKRVVDEADEYQENYVREAKEKKEVKKNILKKIEDRLLANVPKNIDDDLIKTAILDYHNENELVLRTFQLQAYYDTLKFRWGNSGGYNWAKLHLFKDS